MLLGMSHQARWSSGNGGEDFYLTYSKHSAMVELLMVDERVFFYRLEHEKNALTLRIDFSHSIYTIVWMDFSFFVWFCCISLVFH